MESLKLMGVPVFPIILAAFIVWAVTEVIKSAERAGKKRYLFYSALGSIAAAVLVTYGINPQSAAPEMLQSQGPWNWRLFSWVAVGAWIVANLGHKYFAAKMRDFFKKAKVADAKL